MDSTNRALFDALKALSVPIADDPCRTCTDPCEDLHGDWPNKFEVDMDSTLLGTRDPLHRQVVISTGRADWVREVTEDPGSIAELLLKTRDTLGPKPFPPRVPKGTPAPLPLSSQTYGVFAQTDSNALSILNGSHVSISDHPSDETVLLFPDYAMIVGVRADTESVHTLYKTVLEPSVSAEVQFSSPTNTGLNVHVLPYSCVIMLCSHKKRDNRCHIAAPKLEERFSDELERVGWEVHTRLHDPDHDHAHDQQSRDERLRAAADSQSALIVKTSHIGGHRYAGNVQIMFPQGTCVWYARVSPHEVHAIVQHTILSGRILPQLLRAGMNVVRKEGKTLADW
ncbi:Sucraseferredoxin-like protein [Auriculariales sp. MPI-PUGE-AT-0066]|nr:Sucraseferredoxin-like protein [Auriculariales sp. MPI-PUGE-AT-0066]